MKGIYKVFKSEMQKAIKVIAEKYSISPMWVLTTTKGDVFNEYQTKLEQIAQAISSDFDIDKENIYQMEQNFFYEAQVFICPEFNSTNLNGKSVYEYLNRQLVEAGYETINPEALGLLFDEIKSMKVHSEENKSQVDL